MSVIRGQLSAKDAAAYLSYARAQFNALVKANQLPAPNEAVRGHPRWSVRALDAWTNGEPERHAADVQAAQRQQACEALANYKPKIRARAKRDER